MIEYLHCDCSYGDNRILLADSKILNLPKISLETKELLPEYSGIYYVIDENNTIWYIGKAKNIHKRWLGKSHHRIYQLEKQKQKYFNIYYEQVNFSELDKREKQQIKKYTPHLNDSPVKNKKVRSTETLLRETIATISDFAFILGVEPPRREVKNQIGLEWLIQDNILDLPVIHICLNDILFKNKLNITSVEQYEDLRKQPFKTRKVYASKWKEFPTKFHPMIFRLTVNGYIIEVSFFSFWIGDKDINKPIEYNQSTIASESIKVLNLKSLNEIKTYSIENKYRPFQLQRVNPYTSDLIPLLFKELIDSEAAKQKLYKLREDYTIGKRGLGSRSRPIKSKSINSDFRTIDELLLSRGIEPNKYDRKINIIRKGYQERIELYLKCFNLDPKTPAGYGKNIDGSKSSYYNSVVGILDNKKVNLASYQFDIVYLLASVDLKAWLLVENYLQDFATAFKKLNNGEGITNKFYVSPRKFIAPAKVNIKLESIRYSAWIPFGMSEQYSTFEAAKIEIKRRLEQANLPNLKLTFRREQITK